MKTLLMMTLTGSILVLLVMALRSVLGKKLHPRLIYLLWLPVVLSLLIPLRFESPLSLRNAPPVRYVEQSVSARMEKPLGYGFAATQQSTAQDMQTHTDAPAASAAVNEEEQQILYDRVSGLDAYDVLTVVWIVGAVVTGGYIAFVNLRFRLLVRRSRKRLAVPWILARQMGKMQVYVSKVVPSPCLVGVIKPFIVVTPQALEDETRLVHVLTHEHMHKRQGDAWWSMLRTAALIVHWFNPLVWIAASLSRSDCENACDALTIRTLGEENRVDYGKTLLAFLRARSTPTALINTATTMAQSRRQIRRRISLIAKKQRYAWIAAVLAVVLTLTGCALTMTAPEETEPAVTPDVQPAASPEPSASPAPAESLEPVLEEDALREFAANYEKALSPYVADFDVWEEHDLRACFPEFADCELYGRKNADGDAYVLVKLLELQKASAYQDVILGAWQEVEGDNELYYRVERIGVLGEPGNFTEVKLDTYELHDMLIVDSIYEIEDALILIPNGSDHVLCALRTVSAIHTELFVRNAYPGASSIAPDQGTVPYLSVPMLNSATMQATGWSTAIPVYLPVEENLLDGLEFEPVEEKNLKEFWEDVDCASMMRLHHDGKGENYILICSDRLIRYEDHFPVSVCEQDVYYEHFNGIIHETFGIDPFFYIQSKAYNSPENVQVKMAMLSFPNYETGEVLTQTLSRTDAQKLLNELQELVFEPDDILTGGAGCPFGGVLTLQTSECEFTFHVAADSCGVLCYEGNIYLDYGGQNELFEIFPECNPYTPTYTYTGENAPKPVTLEVLAADAPQWDIYEEDKHIQVLYEFVLTKMNDSDGEPAEDGDKFLYLMDFRDDNVAQILHVEVRAGSFVVDGRVYPDKKRELPALIDVMESSSAASPASDE